MPSVTAIAVAVATTCIPAGPITVAVAAVATNAGVGEGVAGVLGAAWSFTLGLLGDPPGAPGPEVAMLVRRHLILLEALIQ